jgi:hypothetical protein
VPRRRRRGLMRRYYENMGFGPGGPSCSCCSILRKGKDGGSPERTCGRLVRRRAKRQWQQEAAKMGR